LLADEEDGAREVGVIRENADDGSVSVPMARWRLATSMCGRREDRMDALLAIIAIAFVVLVLMVVVSALFEMSPFASHEDRFHKPGERQASPRLD
jgi:hypothetical protein